MDDSLVKSPELRRQLEKWLKNRRWFAGKARVIENLRIVRQMDYGPACLLVVEVTYVDGSAETYSVPLAAGPEAESEAIIAELDGGVLYDATYDVAFRDTLFQKIFESAKTIPESRLLEVEQSHTSIIYGDRYFVKLYRKLSKGINPDAELIRFLSEQAGYKHVPTFCGELESRGTSLAFATGMVPNRGTAWDLALREMPESGWLQRVELLGRRTGQMHLALASEPFAPEPFSKSDADKATQKIEVLAEEMIDLLAQRADSLPSDARPVVEKILQSGISSLTGTTLGGLKIRTHGDYHLGQVLDTGDDFVIIDFEGEPSRSLEERRAKQPPLRDVAGMLRSLHYAAHASEKSEDWAANSQNAFLRGWRTVIAGSLLDVKAQDEVLHHYLLEKAIYEVIYEINHRPDWIEIPLRGLEKYF